ncbi:hypothetical protein PV10_00822 [Exophiala mesophila]|uniref:Uncharacterized protein n=1 Tax=Exophiala mesophila TaxID=212818 RepID=A0A0D1X5J0_EXOME|nr:uncharacterized protein PV10_00822 [Exophiala mesophila]KIV97015.1 hypothetical protein PV10_00822 [Exophiala mesophila]
MADAMADILAMDDPDIIRDELALYEGMLASLQEDSSSGSDPETQVALRDTRLRLDALRRQLRSITTAQNPDSTEMPIREHLHNNGLPVGSSSPSSASRISPSNSSDLSTGPRHQRPKEMTRGKRERPHLFEESRRHSKSRRTSPSPSSHPSPSLSTTSLESLDFDNPTLTAIFRNNPDRAAREQEALAQIHERRQQEERDAEFALELSRDLASGSPSITNPPSVPSESSQSLLRTDGTINRQRNSRADISPKVEHASINSARNAEPTSSFLPSSSRGSRGLQSGGPSTAINADGNTFDSIKGQPAIVPSTSRFHSQRPSGPQPSRRPGSYAESDNSDSSLEEIPQADFVSRQQPSSFSQSPRFPHQTRSYSWLNTGQPGFGMPGAFPGTTPAMSVAGSSVYNSRPSTGPTSALGSVAGSSVYNTRPSIGPTSALGNIASSLQRVPLSQYKPTVPLYSANVAERMRDYDPTEEVKGLLENIRPDEAIEKPETIQPPPGLKAVLMPHQLKGLAWMRKMEESTNKGGILADDMGLGKTIQSIALILDRPPPENSHRPSLIVAPVALLLQWQREFEKMVKPSHRLKILIYHGASRNVAWADLKSYDVVLTTYGTLVTECKRLVAWHEKLKMVPDAVPTPAEECSILGDKSRFHRIILDEAQNIKNRNAKGALAAFRLISDYKWALTGTPMMNGPKELYSLIKFLGIKPYCDWNKFDRDIARPLTPKKSGFRINDSFKVKAMRCLQALLRAVLLRRTKQSKINGKPILQLPPKHTTVERVAFNADELAFYQALEKKAQVQFNRYVANGSGGIGQNYSNMLVLLLRLRQACCHPRLVVDSSEFMVQLAGSLSPPDLKANAAALDPKVVSRLKALEAFECPICMDASENPAIFPCGHALCNDCLSRLVEQVSNTEEDGRPVVPKCPHCRSPIDSRKITDVISFLRVHDPDREGLPSREEDDDDDDDDDTDTDSDADSSDEGDDLSGFVVHDDFIEDSASDATANADRKQKGKESKKSRKSKKRKSQSAKPGGPQKSLAVLRKEGLKNKAAKKKYIRRLRKTFQPSAKTTKTMEILQEIRARGNKEKTIIFSNFTSLLDLLEVALSDYPEFGGYGRYDGSMSSDSRNAAVLEFTDNPDCLVILVSLRAGNAGLNLTAANHVIMMDPFWNPFVEFQAADRCYRIGQVREVTVHRVLISDEGFMGFDPETGATVEDRILALQERKRAIVETALDEKAGSSLARLGVRELGYLFGLNSMG